MGAFLQRIRDNETAAEKFVRAPEFFLAATVGTSRARRDSFLALLSQPRSTESSDVAPDRSTSTANASLLALAAAVARLALTQGNDADEGLAGAVVDAARNYRSSDTTGSNADWRRLGDALASLGRTLPYARRVAMAGALQRGARVRRLPKRRHVRRSEDSPGSSPLRR